MQDILLLSKDRPTIALYRKLAARLAVPLVPPAAGADPAAVQGPLLVDADSWPTGAAQRDRLVDLLCRQAASVPVACFGYRLTDRHRAALEAAGVVVARGPGRTLLRTLAFWGTVEPEEALEPEAE